MNELRRRAVKVAILKRGTQYGCHGFTNILGFFNKRIVQETGNPGVQQLSFLHLRSVGHLSDLRKRKLFTFRFFLPASVGQTLYVRIRMSDKIDLRFPARDLPLKAKAEEEAKTRGVSVAQVIREAMAKYFGQAPQPTETGNFFQPK